MSLPTISPEESGALRRGHFLLSSGLHSEAYVQCALLLEDPVRARQVGSDLAEMLRSYHPDSVLAPALGGVIIGHEVAAELGVPFRFTERKGDEMGLRRGFTLRQGERVVIIEDVVTTGRSTLETASLATARGARVVAIGAIIDRTAGRDPFDGSATKLWNFSGVASQNIFVTCHGRYGSWISRP